MKLSANWIRDFVKLTADDHQLAEGLTAVGIAVEGMGGSGADTVFEMEVGTNRPDAMNHYGVAREAAAIFDVALKPLDAELPSAAKAAHSPRSHGTTEVLPFPITVEETRLCPRFTARVVKGVKIRPSPEKIAHRLQLIDQRPISNAVDATNYVLWEMGKPTHVFDMDLLDGGRLIIRKAKQSEKLRTLDGIERTLSPEDLVVADAKRPVGLAGVMGGYDTMITDKTKNILIESAWWDPLTVRKTARRHGIHTDASHRFERGADFESTVLSCDLVAKLIVDSGGGELSGDPVDVISRELDQAPIVLRVSEVRRILGDQLTGGHIFRILKKLGFNLIPEGEEDAEFRVQVPSWRLDVEREIDLIEEIARLHGYDKFANTLPAFRGAVVELPNAGVDKTFRERARAFGYNEAVSLTFISNSDAEKFSSASVLELENPLSEEARVMRTSLVPGMLDMLAWNLNRDVDDVRLFEMGKVYELCDGERIEPEWACLGTTISVLTKALPAGGELDVSKGETAAAAEAFRLFKGDVENLLAVFECGHLGFDRQTAHYFHPRRSARALVNRAVVAQFGQMAEGVKSDRKMREDIFLAEFDLDALHKLGLRRVKVEAPAKYPAVDRDFSFIFSDDIEFAAMHRAVSELQLPILRSFVPVEIYRGDSIGTGKYSILLRVKLQSDEGTLRDDQIAAACEPIVKALQTLGGVQRA
jgi:phenylalanyl-tRNA synthetase beta chain